MESSGETTRLTGRLLEAFTAEQVLLMVEIRARRGDRTLHNYAAHLLRVAGGRVTEWRMVDAKPEESDAFWSHRA